MKVNELYMSDDENNLGNIQDFKSKFPSVQEVYKIKTSTPHFQVYGPNLANNYLCK